MVRVISAAHDSRVAAARRAAEAIAVLLVLAAAGLIAACGAAPAPGATDVPNRDAAGQPIVGGGDDAGAVTLVVGDPRLTGLGSAPDAVEVRGPDGTSRGTGEGAIEASGWSALVLDALGDDAYARSGDQLVITTGTTTRVLDVPALRLDFGPGGGPVAGQTAPTANVAIDASNRFGRASVAGRADGEGVFDLVTDPPELLVGNSLVTITVVTGALTLVVPRRVPYARISTHPGDVTGYAAPLSAVTLTLFGGGANEGRLARATLATDAAGRFDGWLRGPAGERVRPAPGDRVRIADADGQRDVAVAPLEIAPDLAAGILSGEGRPGDVIQITAWNPWLPRAAESPTTTVAAGGGWSVAMAHGLPPATHFYVTERGARGDETFHCYQVPRLHVEPGSAEIGIEALWDVRADLALQRGGATIGRAVGGGLWANDVALTARAPAGDAVPVEPGDRLVGSVDGRDVAVDVPELSAAIGPDGAIAGDGPPGATVELASESLLGITATVGADGRYRMPVSASDLGWRDDDAPNTAVAPGTMRQVTLALPTGQAARVRLLGPRLAAALGLDRVTGQARPNADVVVEHVAAGGATYRAAATADTTGAFTATLGAPVQPDDRLVLNVGGTRVLTATVPAIVATWDPNRRRLAGSAPPEIVLDVSYWYGDDGAGAAERAAAITRGDGSFELDLPAPNPRRIELAFEEPGVRIVRVVSTTEP